ncbi:MAG: chemotaxis protein CheX [Planctomycetia bacterium]|jgi:chemotaxis protein CheX
MKAEHINPFIVAVTTVFKQALNLELERGEISLKSNCNPSLGLSAILSLTGKASGLVVLSIDQAVATHAAEVFLGEKVDTINQDVIDLTGELGNMVAGKAKSLLEQYEMSLGLPSVITGKDHVISFPVNVQPIEIPFTSPMGAVQIDAGLEEN